MRTTLRILAAALFLLVLPSETLAHSSGQPPYVYINGVATQFYPVGSSSLPSFSLPQDSAPSSYLVGQSLEFKLDMGAIPLTNQEIPKAGFHWDFGDGSSADGAPLSHSFRKPGSYTVTLHAVLAGRQPLLLDTVRVDILATSSYKLPTSIIKVNGGTVANPYADKVSWDFSNPVAFDGSASKAGSAPIVSYQWDFGDQSGASSAVATHQYNSLASTSFSLLRVVDANGFITDSFVALENTSIRPGGQSPVPGQGGGTNPAAYFLIALALAAATALLNFWRLRQRKQDHGRKK